MSEKIKQKVDTQKYGILVGAGLVGVMIVGGCIATGENNPAQGTNTVDILPKRPTPSGSSDVSASPSPTTSAEVRYPALGTRPTDIPKLGSLCLANPIETGTFIISDEETVLARVDGRCQGGDPNKAFQGPIKALADPQKLSNNGSFSVETGDLASAVCQEAADDRVITSSNSATSSVWIQADFYGTSGSELVSKGRGYVPEGVLGFPASSTDPDVVNNLPPCSEPKQNVYFP